MIAVLAAIGAGLLVWSGIAAVVGAIIGRAIRDADRRQR